MGVITETVTELNPSIALPVKLAGGEYFLPWKHVGAWIAYFDPRREDLCEAGAIELARMAAVFNPTLLVTIGSSKSEGMVRRTLEYLQNMGIDIKDMIIFAKGEASEMIEYVGNAAFHTAYSPITAPRGEQRVMTASYGDVALLRKHGAEGRTLVVDDVVSTCASIRAAHTLIRRALGGEQHPIPTLAVMRECLVGDNGKMQEKPVQDLYYAVRTPVIFGDVSQIPQGYMSEPFIGRIYTSSEREHLQNVADNPSLPEQLRFDARLALAGMHDVSPQGLGYMTNTWH